MNVPDTVGKVCTYVQTTSVGLSMDIFSHPGLILMLIVATGHVYSLNTSHQLTGCSFKLLLFLLTTDKTCIQDATGLMLNPDDIIPTFDNKGQTMDVSILIQCLFATARRC